MNKELKAIADAYIQMKTGVAYVDKNWESANDKQSLNEGKLATQLPSDKPEKREGYYILDSDGGEVEYGPWELSYKGFKQAKADVSGKERIVAVSRDIKTGKMKWNLVRTDGGMKRTG